MNLFFLGCLAFVGGIAVAVQARIMGNVEARLNVSSAIFINFFFGSLVIASSFLLYYAIDFFSKKQFSFNAWLDKSLQLKWWEYTSGIFGIIIVGIIGFSAARLGIVATLVFFLVGQITTAIFLDHFGFFGGKIYSINLYKSLALLFFFVGLFFFVKS